LYPDRFAAAAATVPVADYAVAYEDESPELQAFDRSLFLGSPEENPDLYTERSPITYVGAVRTPVLILAGDHDSRCPIRQVLNYVDILDARGLTHEVYRFEAGHGSLVIDERIRQMQVQLAFVAAHVPAAAATGTATAPASGR
jgi:dipeptidyl aminopeptidase/acylaminoacyl peptidase